MNAYEIVKTESRLPGLQLALLHQSPTVISNDFPVLFLHGASFPSALASGFRMSGYSWIDYLANKGYDVYALDFLGYGHSDRYPQMALEASGGTPLGRAAEVYLDVDKAVECIRTKTGKKKVYLIAHSWGGAVAALYSERFPDKVAKLVLFAAVTQRSNRTDAEAPSYRYESMTPAQRVNAMKELTPVDHECQLEPEVLGHWGSAWLQSDPLHNSSGGDSVRFPSGYALDLYDMLSGKPVYHPEHIFVPVLLIRGEWDPFPNGSDEDKLFSALQKAPYKKYVVVAKGTHVMHLEKNREQLYEETFWFLQTGVNQHGPNPHAIAVLFEVVPKSGKLDAYLDLAAKLKPELERIKGFLSIERFQSLHQPEKILSLSFWESEEAIRKWRNLETHRFAQAKGREGIFKDYHLRIAQVIRDYGMYDRREAPADSKHYHKKDKR